MKWVLIALCVSGLASCTSYSDLKQRPADFQASTSKGPQDYLECVVPKWADRYAGSHIIVDGTSRVLVAPVGGGTPSIVALTLAATPEAGKTRVEMRHLPSLSNFNEQWHQAEACL